MSTKTRLEGEAGATAAWDERHAFLTERLQALELTNSQLAEEKRQLETEYRSMQSVVQRLDREVRRLKAELERLRAPPLLVGYVKDVLPDGRAVIKSSAGPHFLVRVAEFVNLESLEPGARVGVNQQTLSVVSVLPPSLDARVYGAEVVEKPTTTYEDVGGLDAQLTEVREAVEYPLTRREAFERLGIEPPKGVLLHGPPGTGKTLIAKAVARQTNACFVHVVGSELVQKYIGEGARLVRELFQMAREKGPTILFIDEMDAIGATRYEASTSGDREVQRTLVQLLAEMDGFDPRGEVRIIGATNRLDMLDAALLRPGRFDRLIEIPSPDAKGRLEILRIHSRRMPLAPDVDLETLAHELRDGTTGAEIQALCMEAGMFALRENTETVTGSHFLRGKEKVMSSGPTPLGPDAAFA